MSMNKPLLIAAALTGLALGAQAKLPAPPPMTPEAAAKADEAKARAAYNVKLENYKLCKSMDKVAAQYFKTTGAGKQPTAGAPSCSDPGVFAYVPPRPLESSESHSPPGPASKPPSSNSAGPEKPTPQKP